MVSMKGTIIMRVIQFFASMELRLDDPLWIASQIFAFLALIFAIWAFQVKAKIKLLLLTGIFSTFLAASASLLGNFTLGVLFGLAAIRNYVFMYVDMRIAKGKVVKKWIHYGLAVVFAVLTIGSTVLLVHIMGVATYGAWLEWMICATLLGLIVGNVLEGTNLMRVSFVANRVFNIINHVYFNNVIAVIIAVSAIGSNAVYYTRMLVSWSKARKKRLNGETEEEAQDPVQAALDDAEGKTAQ